MQRAKYMMISSRKRTEPTELRVSVGFSPGRIQLGSWVLWAQMPAVAKSLLCLWIRAAPPRSEQQQPLLQGPRLAWRRTLAVAQLAVPQLAVTVLEHFLRVIAFTS